MTFDCSDKVFKGCRQFVFLKGSLVFAGFVTLAGKREFVATPVSIHLNPTHDTPQSTQTHSWERMCSFSVASYVSMSF